jgi:hypothetical protein
MSWRLVVLIACVAATASGCDSPTSPGIGTGTGNATPPPSTPGINCSTNRGTLSATVDGAPWTSLCVPAASWLAGNLAIGAANDTEVMTLTANVAVPGNYTGQIGGAVGSLTRGTGAPTWTSGPAGTMSLVITRLDLQGASGTFSFSAGPVAGTAATGTRSVTNGSFDVTF